MSEVMVDWNELSKRGLIVRINTEVMHPLGLAVCRTLDGNSPGAIVSDDGKWEYVVKSPTAEWIEVLEGVIETMQGADSVTSVLQEIRSYLVHNQSVKVEE